MTSSAEVNRALPAGVPEMLSKSLNNSVVKHVHSFPRYDKILPDGGNSTTVGASATQIRFEIPAGVYNLGKTVLRYTRYASNAEAKAVWERQDVTPISILELTRKANDFSMSKISFVDHLSKIMPKIKTPMEEFQANTDRDLVYPCNVAIAGNLTGDSTLTGSVPFIENKYTETHATRLPEKYKTIQLNKIADSIFSVDEMVYYQYPMYLSVTFNPVTQWGWISTAETDGTTGLGPLVRDINLTNIDLLVAKETDPDVSAECKRLVLEGGFKMIVPVTNSNTADGAIATETDVRVDLGAYMGDRILRIYAIPEMKTAGQNLLYSSRNDGANARIIGSFQSFFNGDSIQGNAIRVSGADNSDWLRIRDYLKGSAMLNEKVYRENWFILDDFSGITQDTKVPMRLENILAGKKLGGEALTYRIQTHNVIAVRWYIYVVGQRVLRIAPDEKGGWGWV